MEGSPQYFVGIDRTSDKHDACVLDASGVVRASFIVAHSAEGLAELRHRLRRFGAPARLPVAIKRPSGLLADTLVEAGYPVVPIHPNALEATHPRYSAARTLWRCWHNHIPYDITKHGRAIPFLEQMTQTTSAAA